MISALNEKEGIKESDITSNYWQTAFVFGGRVQPEVGSPGVTYTYTAGQPAPGFVYKISATLTTLCPVALDTYDSDFSTMELLSWTFSDGVHTISSSDATGYIDPSVFNFSTSSSYPGTALAVVRARSGLSNFILIVGNYFNETYWDGSSGPGGQPAMWWYRPTGTNACATANYVKYSYAGNPMSSTNSVRGFFITAAPLGPALSGVRITPLAWGMTDGSYSMNFGNGDQLLNLQVWTDPQGAIIGWNFSATGKALPAGGGTLSTINTQAFIGDSANVQGLIWSNGCGPCSPHATQNTNNPGTWTASNP